MLFTSIDFISLLLLLVIIVWRTPVKYRWIVLLISSCFLYLSWNIISLISVLFCSLLNYFFANLIFNSTSYKKRSALLTLNIILSILPLILIKYSSLLVQLFWGEFDAQLQFGIDNINWFLPIGISFYTFQNLSYTIDVYRKNIISERNVGLYILYSSFFPLQLSGPIERASNLLTQLKSKIQINQETIFLGIKLMLWGYFKKLVIADSLSGTIDPIYENPLDHSAYMLMLGSILYSFQIYADFSGYVDIARGVAKLFGIDLSINFNYPYYSHSIKEFWHRWHITLSRWFKDYIYISLGGNKQSKIKWGITIFIVFLVSGLWHGSGFNYLAWGLLHAIFYLVGNITLAYRDKIYLKCCGQTTSQYIRPVLTFLLVTLAWIFFRANTLPDAIIIISVIINKIFMLITMQITDIDIAQINIITSDPRIIFNIILLTMFLLFDKAGIIGEFLSRGISTKPTTTDLLVANLMIVLILFLGSSNTREFIYMSF